MDIQKIQSDVFDVVKNSPHPHGFMGSKSLFYAMGLRGYGCQIESLIIHRQALEAKMLAQVVFCLMMICSLENIDFESLLKIIQDQNAFDSLPNSVDWSDTSILGDLKKRIEGLEGDR